ncbi:Bestrophin [Fasciola hepatica]|uniref:Bestrophin homolog n=1 Tax=Fasciola hepatica TaxID=6192 RepID=A0A4E0RID6_FASHE|nr:Bestrophin [Fasciola hepatica]
MTVSYASIVATTTYSTFLRLLFLWKGSVYRLIWFELLIFTGIYSILSLTYRFLLTGMMKTYFEWLCLYCNQHNEMIPVPFVLGFYVSLVVTRWWEQFLSLPWPDQLALQMTAYCHGNDERPTRIRRTVMRYTNLAYCIALRAISSRARLRFPTAEHLVSAGLMTEEELDVLVKTEPTEYQLYFVPLVWALNIVSQARQEGHIRFDRAVEILTEEITTFRGKLGTIFAYDWINPPLVYTQMATIVVYSYFLACLFAWQYLDLSKGYPGYDIDIYVPVFGLLRFFFYIGWLKVAESLINPFGEDADDFEIEYLIERNLNVSYLIVDEMHHEHPELVRDAFWGTADFTLSKSNDFAEGDAETTTGGAGDGDKFTGSLANLNVMERRPSLAFWRSASISKPFASTTNLSDRKVSQL